MATAVGTVYVDVKPNLSKFRETFRLIKTEEITDVLELYLLPYMPRNRSRADLAVVAAALLNRFTILPHLEEQP